jgi:hypothetical protein
VVDVNAWNDLFPSNGVAFQEFLRAIVCPKEKIQKIEFDFVSFLKLVASILDNVLYFSLSQLVPARESVIVQKGWNHFGEVACKLVGDGEKIPHFRMILV